MPDQTLLIHCSCPDRETAELIAGALLEQRLAACVSISTDITSCFRWQGKLERSQEVLLLIKSGSRVYPALEQAILSLHPYELPEIIAVPVERGLPGYLHWVEQCLTTNS